jgi:hypothetical protein
MVGLITVSTGREAGTVRVMLGLNSCGVLLWFGFEESKRPLTPP